MSNWTQGYVSDIQYVANYYREMAPTQLAYAVHSLGVRAPDVSKPFTYCELGSGQGYGTALMAAANPTGTFYGYDFNPGQTANARSLASAAGLTNVHFEEDDFAVMAEKPAGSYPTFDFIALHGIYSWVSPSLRRSIVRFIDKYLRPGGIVYVSYNAMPGRNALVPFQRFLLQHAARMGGNSEEKFASGYNYVAKLIEKRAYYFEANSVAANNIGQISKQNPTYLVHEWLNGNWNPLFVTDVAAEMAEAKLDYVGSATIAANIQAFTVMPDHVELLDGIGDPLMRELVRDFLVNEQFRRDIYIRGRTGLTTTEYQEINGRQRFRHYTSYKNIGFNISTPIGQYRGKDEELRPIIEAAAEKSVSALELQNLKGFTDQQRARIAESIAILVHAGYLFPLPPELPNVPGAAETARRFNAEVVRRTMSGGKLYALACPELFNGTYFGIIDLVMLGLLSKNPNMTADKIAAEAWVFAEKHNQPFTKDGKPVTDINIGMPMMVKEILSGQEKRVPVWKRLGLL